WSKYTHTLNGQPIAVGDFLIGPWDDAVAQVTKITPGEDKAGVVMITMRHLTGEWAGLRTIIFAKNGENPEWSKLIPDPVNRLPKVGEYIMHPVRAVLGVVTDSEGGYVHVEWLGGAKED